MFSGNRVAYYDWQGVSTFADTVSILRQTAPPGHGHDEIVGGYNCISNSYTAGQVMLLVVFFILKEHLFQPIWKPILTPVT